MSVPIPHYLTDLAVLEKQTDTRTFFSIRCTCGCNQFFVYENHFSKEELAKIKPYCEAMAEVRSGQNVIGSRDENGNFHYWKLLEPQKGSDGAREEILVPRCPFFAGIAVIKAQCASCGKEHVIFDSRRHGYDGMTGEKTAEEINYKPSFQLKNKTAVSLTLKIENDASFEEFNENCDLGFTPEQYADAFSWLTIYKTSENGKKTKIFDWETA